MIEPSSPLSSGELVIGGMQYGVAEILTVVAGLIGFIAGFTRLEGKNSQNGKDLEKLDSRLTTLEAALAAKLSAIEKSLAKIEGRLQNRNAKHIYDDEI